MEWFGNIIAWFQGAGWAEIAGVIALWLLAFDRLAALTPTETDNKILASLYKIFSFLGVKVPDNTGKPEA